MSNCSSLISTCCGCCKKSGSTFKNFVENFKWKAPTCNCGKNEKTKTVQKAQTPKPGTVGLKNVCSGAKGASIFSARNLAHDNKPTKYCCNC